MSRNTQCAQCEFFTLKNESGEPLPQAAHGMGACHGFDGHVTPVEPFVRWDAPTCVLFGRAKDWQKREQWIAMRKRAEEEGANAAAA
jgi:hypothetical protein